MRTKSIVLIIVAFFVVAVGVGVFLGLNPRSLSSSEPASVSNSIQEKTGSQVATIGESTQNTGRSISKSGEPQQNISQETFTGELVAGSFSKTPYVRYNKADFEKARSEGRAIYIYVYATWCPICAAERPSILAAFDELDSPTAVGFETHWIDGQDNDEDHDLQRTFGVAQQHTHIFLKKDGNVAEKIFTPISKDEIKSKILNIA